MKRMLRHISFVLLFALAVLCVYAQAEPVPDQNPHYAASRDKYVKLADSLTTWHGNTFQETYKAIDYLQDKQEARQARRAFRRELRLQGDLYGWAYPYNNYYYPAYGNRLYSPSGFYHHARYNYHYYSSSAWQVLPWALTLGLLFR